jgi:hypothetical protein
MMDKGRWEVAKIKLLNWEGVSMGLNEMEGAQFLESEVSAKITWGDSKGITLILQSLNLDLIAEI